MVRPVVLFGIGAEVVGEKDDRQNSSGGIQVTGLVESSKFSPGTQKEMKDLR